MMMSIAGITNPDAAEFLGRARAARKAHDAEKRG